MTAFVEDTVNNLDVDNIHKDRHADNLDDGHTYRHEEAHTWPDVVRRVTIKGRNVHICTA